MNARVEHRACPCCSIREVDNRDLREMAKWHAARAGALAARRAREDRIMSTTAPTCHHVGLPVRVCARCGVIRAPIADDLAEGLRALLDLLGRLPLSSTLPPDALEELGRTETRLIALLTRAAEETPG